MTAAERRPHDPSGIAPAPARSPLSAFGPADDRARLRLAAPLLVALVAMLVYANAVGNGFALDDGGVIARNALVKHPSGFWRAFVTPYWPPPLPGGQYRPLGIVSFTLDWLAGGGSPHWFHFVNLLWHAAAAVAVWFLAAELLAPAGALAAALLFAVHPVHTEAVANVIGRLEPMAALFIVAALLAHRRRSWWAPALFALGLLCKENAIVFLGLAVAADLLVAPREPEEESRRRVPARTASRAALAPLRERWRLYAVYAGIVAMYGAALVSLFHGQEFAVVAPTFAGATTGQRLLTVATIIPHYARLLLFPASLSGDYLPQVIPLATSLTTAGVLGLLLVAALAAGIARAWRPAPELAFALLWVPIAISPVSNVLFPSGVSLAERTLYLPSVGACIALGWVVQRVALRAATPAPVLAALAAVLFLGAVRTWTRNPVWHDDKTYVLTHLRDHPESYRAHLIAGRVLLAAGHPADAGRQFEEARRLFKRDANAYYESAVVAALSGDFAAADAMLDTAAAVMPGAAVVHMAQADVRLRLRDYEG
ncbi:MAG TPA: hypothetical protein VFS05_01885, partial [Gemmatimonadaceae bacterium]|nr:hypothetical protein [Gemmatimonadaceae bacterium]